MIAANYRKKIKIIIIIIIIIIIKIIIIKTKTKDCKKDFTAIFRIPFCIFFLIEQPTRSRSS